jgi:hypothetical protein
LVSISPSSAKSGVSAVLPLSIDLTGTGLKKEDKILRKKSLKLNIAVSKIKY